MDALISFMRANAGGFVTGPIIATAQLAVVYLWIDRYIEKLQQRSEAKKWQQARNELDATLMSLSYQLVQPLNYYTLQDDRSVFFRQNYQKCLKNIIEKSISLDSMLSIYSIGLEPRSFTRINQVADRLRASALDARTATDNWLLIEDTLPAETDLDAKHIRGLRRAIKAIEFGVPTDPDQRAERYFAHYTLQVLHQIVWIARQLLEVSQYHCEPDQLDTTSFYRRKREFGPEEETAHGDLKRTEAGINRLVSLIETIELKGLRLAIAPELD